LVEILEDVDHAASIDSLLADTETAEKREIFPVMIGDGGPLQYCQFSGRDGETLVVPAHQISTILKKAKSHAQALQWHRCTPHHTEVITASLPGQMVAIVCPSTYDDERATPEEWEWSLRNDDLPPHPARVRHLVLGPAAGRQMELI
jgi:hypothetical protein